MENLIFCAVIGKKGKNFFCQCTSYLQLYLLPTILLLIYLFIQVNNSIWAVTRKIFDKVSDAGL